MSETRAYFREVMYQLRRDRRDALHVTTVFRVQKTAGNFGTGLPAITGHLGTLTEHFLCNGELFFHDGRRPLLAREIESCLPTSHRHLPGNILGKLHGLRRAVLHSHERDGAAQSEETHSVAALAHDLTALLFQRQAVDLDHVIEHARESLDNFLVFDPVELGKLRERMLDEACQVDRAQQTGTV